MNVENKGNMGSTVSGQNEGIMKGMHVDELRVKRREIMKGIHMDELRV
jgi:hypothetical protein